MKFLLGAPKSPKIQSIVKYHIKGPLIGCNQIEKLQVFEDPNVLGSKASFSRHLVLAS